MKKTSFMFLILLLSACAHHRDVRPGVDGLNNVAIRSSDDDEATRDAIAQANHYCAQSHRTAAFVDESQKYTGDLDEKTYRTGKRVTKVAEVIGGPLWVFGGRRERNVGGIVGLGGIAGDAALGKGYTVNMKFKCQ